MWIAIAIIIIIAIIITIKQKKDKETVIVINEQKEEIKNQEIKIPYIRKNLLTKNEYYFYKNLKPIADELNKTILCKTRVADLVEIEKGLNNSEWQTAFNKINKKHIDFILCNPDNLYPELLIELDDKSHENEKTKQRDEFIEKVYEKTGYKLLRIKGTENLKEKIEQAIK